MIDIESNPVPSTADKREQHIIVKKRIKMQSPPSLKRKKKEGTTRITFCSSGVRERRRLNTDSLFAENVKHKLRWPVVPVDAGAVLEHLDVVNVLVEQVGAVHRAALGLRVELGREDGSGLVDHSCREEDSELVIRSNQERRRKLVSLAYLRWNHRSGSQSTP